MGTAEIIAAVAAAVAVAALVLAWVAYRALRAIRADQRVVLGDGHKDVVDFAVSLQGRLDDVHRAVDELAGGLTRLDKRIDTAVSNVAVLRYDAYESHEGQQSSTLAILDSSRSGFVISAIQGRDYARIYVKELDHGRSSIPLSPEEEQAIQRAMAR